MEDKVADNLYFILVAGTLGMAMLAVLVVCVVIYYQKRRISHRNELQEIQLKHQRMLLQNSIEIQEKERKRFAQDLHDDTGAILSAAKINLYQAIQGNVNTLTETRELLDVAITGIRRVAHDLSPPGLERFGLYQTLEDVCKTIEKSGKIKIHFSGDEMYNARFSHEIEMAIYRISNEALNNSIKHSVATEVKISLTYRNNELSYTYSDNGEGIQKNLLEMTDGSGIKNMESRVFALNGKMNIRNNTPSGFLLEIQIPLQRNVHAEN